MIAVYPRLKAYKEKTADLLASDEGIRYSGRRNFEPEPVFGQVKSNTAYRRFRRL